MKRLSPLFLAVAVAGTLLVTTTGAFAFCGVIEETASHKNGMKAAELAGKLVRQKVKALRKEHGNKLVLSQKTKSCLGGAVAIDSNGKQIVGDSSCKVTQPFCVNP